MKRIHNLRNVIIVSTIGVLIIALIAATFIFRGSSSQNTDLTTNVRASALTYKRNLELQQTGETVPDVTNTPVVTQAMETTPGLSPTISQTATISAGISATPSPTTYLSPTSTLSASASATPVTSLPQSGWTQNVTIMFIAASVLMFLSFLF